MKIFLSRMVLMWMFLLAAYNCKAQNIFFVDAPETSFSKTDLKRAIVPIKYRTLKLNKTGLIGFLKTTPSEKAGFNHNSSPVIEIPMPDGGTAKFQIWESSVLEPALAAKYPEIKTYTGQGIDDRTANIKLDFTPAGFHAMIISSLKGAVFIDPYSKGNSAEYITYNKSDFKPAEKYNEAPLMKFPGNLNRPASPSTVLAASCIGSQLRTYRLALAANGEYTAFHGGTVAKALAAEATTMNRVNGVYERELAIRMVLVANNDLLIYTNSASDPYDNDNAGNIMLSQNQSNIDAVILGANYDIGHVFSTGGGGVAGLGVVCLDGQKAKGVTGNSNPMGDPFDIDYVAHEMGHQFGANHTFNSISGNCDFPNVTSFANVEPGSGSTIMAYAGICSVDNLQSNSDAQFHAISFNEITQYSIGGLGNSCAVITSTGNTPPVVNAGADYIIPKSTPFSLTGSATDVNGDVLTFSWEEIDTGGPNGSWDNPSGNAPLFRSFVPKSTPVRFFPKLADVINNNINGNKGEVLATYARTLNFRLTARDNRAGGGGVCFDEMALTVNGTAGPFLVTNPNASGITWYVNDFKTVTWDPSGTAAAPISCSNVKIELSTDGGNTYPVTLSANTPNDGSEEIQVPNNVTSSARVRITAIGNVFYDISNENFAIQNSPTNEFVFNNPLQVTLCGENSGQVVLKTASLGAFSTAINLTASGNPVGTTVSIGSSTISPGSNTTVTLNNANTIANGIYNITVNGVAGAVNKSRLIVFEVSSSPAAPSTLSAPANNANGISSLPSFNWSPVVGATSYTLEISTASTFIPIIQTVSNITTLPKILSIRLAENTIYYWRVRTVNNCGTGTNSVTRIFKTGLNPCKNSTDIPKVISATGTPTVTSTLTIPAQSGVTITDLNVVGLTGDHSYVGDITVSLKSPGGKSVILFDQACPGNTDFNINLDDEAANVISCPMTGNQTAKPQNPLTLFDGDNSAGIWTLTVKDNGDQDGGNLTGWGLAINNCVFVATPIVTTPWTQLCPPAANTTLNADLTGTAYQWQVNNGIGFTNINNNANYTGTNNGTLQIINAPSSWSGYQFRCVVDGNNSTVFTLGFTSYWNGSISNAWEDASNWSCNSIPDAYTDVIINSGTVVVNSNGTCRSIAVNPGASVTVKSGFKITVAH